MQPCGAKILRKKISRFRFPVFATGKGGGVLLNI